MRVMKLLGAFVLATVTTACTSQPQPMTPSAPSSLSAAPAASSSPATAPAEPQAHPMMAPWTGPYGGVPPFDKVDIAQFKPALQAAIAEQLAAVDKIAKDPAPATFANTIAALESSGRAFERVSTLYGVWSSSMNTPDFQAVEREMAPQLAAFYDSIIQNEALFRRIDAVYNGPEKASLSPEQQRLAWEAYNRFVRAGAKLAPADKARLSTINQKLAELYTRFSQNVLADESSEFLVLESEANLAGLPDSVREAAAAEAASRKMEGKWVIANTRSSVDPFLTYSQRRDLREKAWRMFVNRGDNAGAADNNATITEILKLRAERAKLLGYATHAHWRLENTMAKTPEAALQLLEQVWKPAVARVRQEVADMQALANKEGAKFKIAPWDYRYYAEKVRKARYDLDETQIKPYLQLDKLREAMFWVAGELFGYAFRQVTDVPVWHSDVSVFEVTDKSSGRHVGLYYFDPYARTGKRSGAWMSDFRNQERFEREITPIVSNSANFVKGKPGQPVLISWDDAETLFHEFGHALHGLSSSVTYPSLAGTAVYRDYVEFPSQLMEHWLPTPQVLERFALHYETGKPIPAELVKRIERASTFNQGFATVEYLASALIDMKLHLDTSGSIDPDAFERDTLTKLSMPSEIVMRHRTPHFLHVFGGDGYSAGYYSYLWADVLTTDAFAAFKQAAGGPYDKDMASRLYKHVFSAGNTVDPAEAYRKFRGQDPTIEGLMKERGFPFKGVK